MYCTNCGTQINETSNFCSQCGHDTRRPLRISSPRPFRRLLSEKQIAGVCAGIAEYFDVDVTLVRLLVITGVIVSGGLLLLAYLAAWILVPAAPPAQMARETQPHPAS